MSETAAGREGGSRSKGFPRQERRSRCPSKRLQVGAQPAVRHGRSITLVDCDSDDKQPFVHAAESIITVPVEERPLEHVEATILHEGTYVLVVHSDKALKTTPVVVIRSVSLHDGAIESKVGMLGHSKRARGSETGSTSDVIRTRNVSTSDGAHIVTSQHCREEAPLASKKKKTKRWENESERVRSKHGITCTVETLESNETPPLENLDSNPNVRSHRDVLPSHVPVPICHLVRRRHGYGEERA